MDKKAKTKKILKIFITIVLLIILICSVIYIAKDIYDKKQNSPEKYANLLENIKVNTEEITEEVSERMLKVQELKKENSDIVGWLQIEGTSINYPVLQTDNNDFYLEHNYKKEESRDGSVMLDKSYDWDIPSSNLLLYAHNRISGSLFTGLLDYKDEDFYKKHTRIRFTTVSDDSEYEIMAVFYSRVYFKSEQNVFRYYYFINAENEEEYNYYVDESKKASIYDTGVTAKYGDQLLTLSTCEYSQEDGRFAIVARKIEK